MKNPRPRNRRRGEKGGNHDAPFKEDHNATLDGELVLVAVKRWAYQRVRSFPDWEFDELVNEAWIRAMHVLQNYDADQGAVSTFLRAALYSPVSSAYHKERDVVVVRERAADGTLGPRQYTTRRHLRIGTDISAERVGERAVNTKEKTPTKWFVLGRGLLGMVGRGMTVAQMSRSLGVSRHVVAREIGGLRIALNPTSNLEAIACVTDRDERQ